MGEGKSQRGKGKGVTQEHGVVKQDLSAPRLLVSGFCSGTITVVSLLALLVFSTRTGQAGN